MEREAGEANLSTKMVLSGVDTHTQNLQESIVKFTLGNGEICAVIIVIFPFICGYIQFLPWPLYIHRIIP